MPLGTRDVMMVIRARDLASRTLRNVGTNLGVMGTKAGATADKLFNISSALTTFGLGIGAVGAAGVAWMNSATDAAMKYNTEAAKTLTQVDQLGVELEDIKDIARDVAREVPAPFEEMQAALYDIFSSMDTNLGGSKILLREFSRAAVAGQVKLQAAARGTIGVLNAYGLEAEDVNRINDIMFQLVRKGVGTYEEFASVIGYATPSAVKAGQSFESLAGMMAFLTRNGLSASSASISAARALDNLANPKIIERLEDMGVKVKDAAGEFLPMVDIVGQLSEKFSHLTGPERAKALQELLAGSGNNVQARRFWSLALTNFKDLDALTKDMINSSGALDDAYAIMFESPQAQIQALKNNYEVLRTEIGDKLLPVKLKLAEAALTLIDKWNSLSSGTQDLIIKIAAFASVFMLVTGIAMVLIGAFGGVIAILMSLGLGFGAAIAVLGGFMAALVLIPVAIFLIIKHFDTLKKVAGAVWGFIKDVASDAWQMMQSFWDWLSSNGVKVWQTVRGAAVDAWHAITDAWNSLVKAFKKGWNWLDKNFGQGFKKIIAAIAGEAGPLLKEFGETAVQIFNMVTEGASKFFDKLYDGFEIIRSVVLNIIIPYLAQVQAWFIMVFGIVKGAVIAAMSIVRAYIETVLGVIVALWQNFGGLIWSLVKNIWNQIANYIATAVKIISNLIQLFLNIFQGDWKEAWQNVKNILKAAWDGIKTAVSLAIEALATIIRELPRRILGFLGDVARLLWNKGKDIINGLKNGMIEAFGAIITWAQGLPRRIWNQLQGLGRLLYDVGKIIIQGLWNGLKDKWNSVTGWVGGLAGEIVNLKGPMSKDKVLLLKQGMAIMDGLHRGLRSGWTDVERTLDRMNTNIGGSINVRTGVNGSPYSGESGTNGQKAYLVVEGDLVVREEAVTSDLDWWARTQTAGV